MRLPLSQRLFAPNGIFQGALGLAILRFKAREIGAIYVFGFFAGLFVAFPGNLKRDVKILDLLIELAAIQIGELGFIEFLDTCKPGR